MRQKFGKLSFVHICKDMPEHKDHFGSDFDAIVDGTYSQMYGGDNIDSYAVYKLENGKIVDFVAWYHEEMLTLLPTQDRDLAEKLIEDYNFRDKE